MWHLIVNVGEDDLYAPPLSASDPRLLIPIDNPTSPWRVGNDVDHVLAQTLGATPNPIIQDLLRLAIAVYAADLRVPRARTQDRWTRDMTLYLPVSNVRTWMSVRAVLMQLLGFLTGDHWEVELRQMDARMPDGSGTDKAFDAVCLFSGGLDSLVGAIDLLAGGRRVALVSHHGLGEGTKSIQRQLVSVLGKPCEDRIIHLPFYVHPDKGNTREGENTMRARSLLFMALGVAVASMAEGKPSLTVPENGLISLNVPLTGSRTGSLSTRTTHPHYIELLRKLLTGLHINVPIDLPYRHVTKGQMLLQVKDKTLLGATVPLTVSCSHPTVGRYAGMSPGNHCGYCVPCIIRLAALKAAHISTRAPDWDVVAKPPPSSSDRAHDVRAFGIAIERLRGSDAKRDVFRILRSGPIPADEAAAFARVYREGMKEVADFLGMALT